MSLILKHGIDAECESENSVIFQVLGALFTLFALRKFGQPFHADIGDKTIFEYMAKIETENQVAKD